MAVKTTDMVKITPVDADGEGKGVEVYASVAELAATIDSEVGSVTAAQISDAGAAGRLVLQDALVADIRTTIELGTAYDANKVAFIAQQSPDFADLAAVTVAYNALLTALITAGVMAAS